MFSTQAAGQSPAAGRDVGHLGDGLHLLRTAYAHLQGEEQQSESLSIFALRKEKKRTFNCFCVTTERKFIIRVAFSRHIIAGLEHIYIPKP